jgi:hypothetical protein
MGEDRQHVPYGRAFCDIVLSRNADECAWACIILFPFQDALPMHGHFSPRRPQSLDTGGFRRGTVRSTSNARRFSPPPQPHLGIFDANMKSKRRSLAAAHRRSYLAGPSSLIGTSNKLSKGPQPCISIEPNVADLFPAQPPSRLQSNPRPMTHREKGEAKMQILTHVLTRWHGPLSNPYISAAPH